MVAAYVVGAYVPSNFSELGLPTCDNSRQTGCIMSWNTSQAGHKGARMLVDNKIYWWRGAWRQGGPPAICVNPLFWNEIGPALATANDGSLPFPAPPFPSAPTTLAALVPHLTGAVCNQSLLDVDIPGSSPKGFRDNLALLYGSYHAGDYGIFYASIRANALDRVKAWAAAHGR